MTEAQPKRPWESKAVWGGVIAMLSGIAALFGLHLAPADQAILAESVAAVAAAVGGALAVYGRVTAKRPIR